MNESKEKKLKTLMLILIWIVMGLCLEIPGPTLIDLKITFNATYEEITRSVSARGIGGFFGSFLAGLLVDFLGPKKDWLLTLSQSLFTVTIMLAPFTRSLTVLWLLFFVLGGAAGIANVTGQRILLEMWREKAASPMHAIHMGFGIGALLAPLIANPFLAVLDFSVHNTTMTESTVHYGQDTYYVIEESRVHLAYVAIGAISFILSLPFFILPIAKCVKRNKNGSQDDAVYNSGNNRQNTLKQLLNPAIYANGSCKYGSFVFIWLLIFYINIVGGEQLFGNFVRTFSVDQLKFSREEASFLDTAFWGSFTVGRFLGSFFSHHININKLFAIDIFINLISVTLLDIFSTKSHTALWIFTVIVGISTAPLFPAGVAYSNTQIQVGGVVLTLICFAAGAGDFIYVWLAGHLYDRFGPRTVLYAMQVSSISVFILAVIFLIIGHYHGNRFDKEMASETADLGEYKRLDDPKPDRETNDSDSSEEL